MATTYLTRTFSSPTNRNIFTWSAWVKRQNFGITENNNALFSGYLNSSVRSTLRFNTDKLNFQDTEGSVEIKTNRLFRDVNAWYHIVMAIDTTQGTASNRVKFYVNGEQETSFAQADYPAQNSNLLMGGADIHYINARNASGSVDSIDDMCYSHIHFTDGTAYDASAFGETDSTTGEWKIKTSPSVTYGNNGFFILKNGNSVTDQSGNSNNWTVGAGTLTNTEDNPSNVFSTFNKIWSQSNGNVGDVAFANGNNSLSVSSAIYRTTPSTLGASTGKYYCEIKRTGTSGDTHIGIMNENATPADTASWIGQYSSGYMYAGSTGDLYNSGSIPATYSSYTTGDIVGIALDCDNGKIYFAKNGVWQNSSDPTNGTNPAFTGLDTSLNYFFCASTGGSVTANFGNGYFGTTAVASAGTNASGIGIFEYDVPTGYTALSTKGLNL
jgi:hypothetical protein